MYELKTAFKIFMYFRILQRDIYLLVVRKVSGNDHENVTLVVTPESQARILTPLGSIQSISVAWYASENGI